MENNTPPRPNAEERECAECAAKDKRLADIEATLGGIEALVGAIEKHPMVVGLDPPDQLSADLVGWADITRRDVLSELESILETVRPKMRELYASLPGVDSGATSIEDEDSWHARYPGYRAMTNVLGDLLALVEPVMYSSSVEVDA